MATDTAISLDEVPFGRFHAWMTACCAGGPFVTGYVLGNIAIALPVMSDTIEVSPMLSGLIGSGALLGAIFGSLIGGRLCDIFGRKRMYLIDFVFLTLISVVSFFVSSAAMCFVLRVLSGMGVGATFAISSPLLAEFAPQKNRGAVVTSQNLMWYLGYATANVACYLMLGLGEGSWRWMLVSAAVPAAAWFALCLRMPESPRWLESRGRMEEVARVLAQVGPNVVLPPDPNTGKQQETASYADIFRGGYGKWVLFVGMFWSASVITTYALGTYTPTILASLGFGDGDMQYLGTALINMLYLIGVVPSFKLIDSAGRRPTLLASLGLGSISLLIIGFTSNMGLPFWVVLVLFVMYGAANALGGAHQYVYPNELFPTQVRATAMGLVTSISRIVSMIGTFLMPIIMGAIGVNAAIIMCGAVMALGAVGTFIMAPETKDMNLTDASSLAKGAEPAPTTAPAMAADRVR